MPLSEALTLLWFDSIIGTLIVPVHTSYVLNVMRIFSEHYPLFAAAVIATLGVLIGMAGNWSIGRLATSITKNPFDRHNTIKLNEHLSKKETRTEAIKSLWLANGHWFLFVAAIVPVLGQAFAVLCGWSGIPLKKLLFPTFAGALLYFFILITTNASLIS